MTMNPDPPNPRRFALRKRLPAGFEGMLPRRLAARGVAPHWAGGTRLPGIRHSLSVPEAPPNTRLAPAASSAHFQPAPRPPRERRRVHASLPARLSRLDHELLQERTPLRSHRAR